MLLTFVHTTMLHLRLFIHAALSSVSLLSVSALFEVLRGIDEIDKGIILNGIFTGARLLSSSPQMFAVVFSVLVVFFAGLVGFVKTYKLARIQAEARDLLSQRVLRVCGENNKWFIDTKNMGTLKSLILKKVSRCSISPIHFP